MREEFEKLVEISKRLKMSDGVYWSDHHKFYNSLHEHDDYDVGYVNGAWYVYQEQQKKIDATRKVINDFFDNQAMTPSAREYANKLADVLELLK